MERGREEKITQQVKDDKKEKKKGWELRLSDRLEK